MKTRSSALVIFALLFAVSSYPSWGFDTTPPKIESCEVTPNSLPSTGGKLTVTAQIKSVNDLDKTPIIRMFNSTNLRWIADVKPAQLTSGDLKNGIWTSTFDVLTDRMPDRYYVRFDALFDKAGNSTWATFRCENAYVDYGGYVPPAPTPSPSPKASPSIISSPTPTVPASTNLSPEISKLIKSLQSEVKLLRNQLARICNVKKKPKGC